MIENAKRYDLWWARVAYEDKPSISKIRPVLIIDQQICAILALKVTSHDKRENFWGEYEIKRWRQAGLSKPSTIRMSKLLKLEKCDFTDKIGTLHIVDIVAVEKCIERIYRS